MRQEFRVANIPALADVHYATQEAAEVVAQEILNADRVLIQTRTIEEFKTGDNAVSSAASHWEDLVEVTRQGDWA